MPANQLFGKGDSGLALFWIVLGQSPGRISDFEPVIASLFRQFTIVHIANAFEPWHKSWTELETSLSLAETRR